MSEQILSIYKFSRVAAKLKSTTDGTKMNFGPMEVIFDVPFDAGCYDIVSPLDGTKIEAGEIVTPAWCIFKCLESNPSYRFACEQFTASKIGNPKSIIIKCF